MSYSVVPAPRSIISGSSACSIHPCCWVNGCQTCRRSASISAAVRSTAATLAPIAATARSGSLCGHAPRSLAAPPPSARPARGLGPARAGAWPPRLALLVVIGVAIAVVAGLSAAGGRAAARPQRAARVDLPGRRPSASTPRRPSSRARSTSCGRSGSTGVRLTVVWAAIAPQPQSTHAARRTSTPATRPPIPPPPGSPYDRVRRARPPARDRRRLQPHRARAAVGDGPRGADGEERHPLPPRPGGVRRLRRCASGAGTRAATRCTAAACRRRCRGSASGRSGTSRTSPAGSIPQWQRVGGQAVMVSPRLYRQYAAAAFAALRATGHTTARDTILIGELAPEGSEATGRRVPDPAAALPARAVLPRRRLPAAARARRPQPRAVRRGGGFVAANPALFTPTGFAHHPYSFFRPPRASLSDPNWAPLSDLGRLEHALDRTFARLRRVPVAAALPDRVRLRDQPAGPVPRGAARHPGGVPRRRPAPGRRRSARAGDGAVPALRRRRRTRRSPRAARATGRPSRPGCNSPRAPRSPRSPRTRCRSTSPSLTSAPARRSRCGG